MSGCLYYPHWDLRDSIFWGNLLVFWDRITFIVPKNHYGFDPYHQQGMGVRPTTYAFLSKCPNRALHPMNG